MKRRIEHIQNATELGKKDALQSAEEILEAIKEHDIETALDSTVALITELSAIIAIEECGNALKFTDDQVEEAIISQERFLSD
jgi:hypothetical protein